MNSRFTGLGMAVLFLAFLALLGGCLALEIVSPRSGDEFLSGNRIRFQARTEAAAQSQVRWIVDGVPAGTGEFFTTTNLSIGWHQVAAELTVHEKTVKDQVDVQVISWKSIPAPHHAPVRAMVRDGQRKVTWLAVPGEGVFKVDDSGAAARYSRSSGDLPSDEVRDVGLFGGEVWIATAAGVGRYVDSAWKFNTVLDGLPSDDIRALAVDSIKSLLWIATPAGAASWDGHSWKVHSFSLTATALAARDGTVWVGTEERGVYRFDGRGWDPMGDGDSKQRKPVEQLLPDMLVPGRIWLAGSTTGLGNGHDGGLDRIYAERGRPLRTKDMAIEEHSGTLWVAEADSLGILRRSPNGLWRRYDAAEAVPELKGTWQAMALEETAGGKWLATQSHIVSLEASGLSREFLDLPDLVAFPPVLFKIKKEGEVPELTLDVTLANLGDGRLEIEAQLDPITGQKYAIQRLYREASFVRQHPVGEFFFHGHRDHNHYHLAALTHYQLRTVGPGQSIGPVVSQTTKVSWCLSDHRRLGSDMGGEWYRCKGEVQGISVGWSDTYAAKLFGQSISLGGVAPGEYWVVVVASTVFAEKNYRNNTAMTLIRFDNLENIEVLKTRMPVGVPMKDRFDGIPSYLN